jgi:molybdopterin-guanine dinucleotide biosynthesis protein A
MQHNTPFPELCVAILAGGQSRRMGFNKALVQVDGRPLIAKLAHHARLLSDQVLVCANDPDTYAFLELPVVCDVFPGQGPLAGLHTALAHTERPLVLLIACDLPNTVDELWRRLVTYAEGYDAVIPQTGDGQVHPLSAVYRRTCRPVAEANLRRGINKVVDLFRDSALRVKWLKANEGHFHDSQFDNLNTPEDLARIVPPRNL